MRYAKTIRGQRLSLSIVGSALLMACAHPAENAPSSTVASRAYAIPRELERFESDVEDTFDTALSGASVGAQVQVVRASWTILRPILARDGARDELLAQINERVERASTIATSAPPSEVARAVNAVSGPLDEIFATYSRGSQPLLLRLDYLGRELLLDGREARWNLAEHHATLIETTWNSLREDSRASSSQPAVVSFTTHLEKARNATQQHAAADLEQASRALLEDVDGLESLLLTQSTPER